MKFPDFVTKKIQRVFLGAICRIPYSQNLFSRIEYYSAYAQGKGWFLSLKSEIDLCTSLLPRGVSCFVDIGGNLGEYSEEVLSRYPDSRITIFEPAVVNCSILCDKFFCHPNVKIIQSALSDCKGVMPLYADAPGSGGASLVKRELDHFGIQVSEVEKVNVNRFDEIWNERGIIDLVKIDVEGFELLVLKGFGELIKSVRAVQFEMGGTDIDTKTFFRDFWYFFTRNNFSLYRMTPSGLVRISAYREHEEGFSFKNYVAFNCSIK